VTQRLIAMRKTAVAISSQAVRLPVTFISLKAKNPAVN
jgi:hypothetical protein